MLSLLLLLSRTTAFKRFRKVPNSPKLIYFMKMYNILLSKLSTKGQMYSPYFMNSPMS